MHPDTGYPAIRFLTRQSPEVTSTEVTPKGDLDGERDGTEKMNTDSGEKGEEV